MSAAVQAMWWALALAAVAGAAATVLARDALRVVMGLGVFLLSLAGLFLVHSMPFLAIAQVFVYVGGVLVLLLFAIMLVQRSIGGSPRLSGRHDAGAFIVSAGAAALLYAGLRESLPADAGVSPPPPVGRVLLGPMLPQFEVAGLLLLVALLAVVALAAGERR